MQKNAYKRFEKVSKRALYLKKKIPLFVFPYLDFTLYNKKIIGMVSIDKKFGFGTIFQTKVIEKITWVTYVQNRYHLGLTPIAPKLIEKWPSCLIWKRESRRNWALNLVMLHILIEKSFSYECLISRSMFRN